MYGNIVSRGSTSGWMRVGEWFQAGDENIPKPSKQSEGGLGSDVLDPLSPGTAVMASALGLCTQPVTSWFDQVLFVLRPFWRKKKLKETPVLFLF